MNKPTLAEREVIIRWSMADKQASIYADNPALIRKLDKLCADHPDAYRCTKDADEFGAINSAPKSARQFGIISTSSIVLDRIPYCRHKAV